MERDAIPEGVLVKRYPLGREATCAGCGGRLRAYDSGNEARDGSFRCDLCARKGS